MGTSAEGSRDAELASSYLDDLEKAIKGFPQEFFSHSMELSGSFLGRKEALIRKLLDDESTSAFSAIERAEASAVDESQIKMLRGRAHRLSGVLWSAMSCSPLGLRIGDKASPWEKERSEALKNAAEHFGEAAALETGPDQAFSIYRLGEVLRNSERFDEAHAAFQRVIDICPDSQTAIDALKQQERVQKARQEAESRKPSPTESKSGPCFIATAAYGSPMAHEVQILRDYRDTVLARRDWGRGVLWVYRRVGPVLAQMIEQRPLVKGLVRDIVLKPAIAAIRRLSGTDR